MLKKLNQQRFAEKETTRQVTAAPRDSEADQLVKRRQATQTEADETQLLMHWYNNETKKWTHLTGGYINEGALFAEIPPVVLRDQGFSGQLANLLVTEVPYNPKTCSEFETLVNGKCVTKNCSYYAFLDTWDAGCIEDSHCLIGAYAYA